MLGGGEGLGDDGQELGGFHGAAIHQHPVRILGDIALPVPHLLRARVVLTQQLHALVKVLLAVGGSCRSWQCSGVSLGDTPSTPWCSQSCASVGAPGCMYPPAHSCSTPWARTRRAGSEAVLQHLLALLPGLSLSGIGVVAKDGDLLAWVLVVHFSLSCSSELAVFWLPAISLSCFRLGGRDGALGRGTTTPGSWPGVGGNYSDVGVGKKCLDCTKETRI